MSNLNSKVPPQDTELEGSILGSMMMEYEAAMSALSILSKEDFYQKKHGLIFDTFFEMLGSNEAIDAITVGNYLKKKNKLEEAGGENYLIDLFSNPCNSANIEHYCGIIKELSMKRQMIKIGHTLMNEGFNPAGDSYEILDSVQQSLMEIADSTVQTTTSTLTELVAPALEDIEKAMDDDRGITGISSGFSGVDRMTAGWQDEDLIIIAGRPSMGKDQPLYSKIKTLNGWKRMGDVEIGDQIASMDGTENVVTGVFPQGYRPVYEIEFSDGRKTMCGKDHLWRIHNRKWKSHKVLSTTEISELLSKPSYKNRLYIDLPTGDYGKRVDIGMSYYLLGFLIGDGGFRETGVRFSTDDAQSLYNIMDKIPTGHEVNYVGQYDYSIRTQNGSPNFVLDSLRDIGINHCKSWDKFIPEELLESDKISRIQLLKGLLDSDGWVEKSGSVRYSSSSEKLAEQVQYLVRSLGGICEISKTLPEFTDSDGNKKSGRLHYRCKIRFKDASKFMTIYKKRSRVKKSRTPRLSIKSIKYVGMDETQCIKVSHPTSTYITDDYITTHNTAWVLNNAINISKTGRGVAIFSLEMSRKALAKRFLSMDGRVDGLKLRSGRIDEDDYQKLYISGNRLSEAGEIYIDDQAAQTVMEIRTKARKMKREGDLGVIMIDYIQLMTGNGKEGSREQEISSISRGLKGLAKDMGIPVIALSQLSRAVEQRSDKRPMLSDLRESGAIEQDADVVCFLYRPEYYGVTVTPDGRSTKGLAELIIGKQRNGPVGNVPISFNDSTASFGNMADNQLNEEPPQLPDSFDNDTPF